MKTNNTLKEYYIKLNKMYNNAVNMLTAINQSLQSSSSEVTVNIEGNDDSSIQVKLPSFLYLENKLEQLSTNFDNLFNMPESGEAWFTNTSNMYKLQMVKANSAPSKPILNSSNLVASLKDNTFLKDLVNPKTYIKINIDNLPDNIDKIFMKKIVIYDYETYNNIANLDITTYDEYKAALYTLTEGTNYEEYDSVLSLPIKKDVYASQFNIINIPQDLGYSNPYKDYTNIDDTDDTHRHLLYQINVNTLQYSNQEDSSITYTLKEGDYLCLTSEYVVYKVKKIINTYNSDTSEYDYGLIIEEVLGHVALQTTEENSDMVLELYNNDYSSYHYVEVPLEENPYIVVFLGTIQNNVRSLLSDAILLNLNNITIVDQNGSTIYVNNTSTPISYIDYYNKYCKNIGDLILGLTETAYPQISNYNVSQLKELEQSNNISSLVTSSISADNILTVKRINNHLIDTVTSNKVITSHKQKAELNSQISSINDNIDQVYTQLTTTDFSQETTITQVSLQAQLNEYYTERTSLQKQVNNLINNINSLKGDVKGTDTAKYRIRGVTSVSDLETYIHENIADNIYLIGCDVEYKYRSVNSDTNNVMSIDNSLFTDWNKLNNIDRQRTLSFNTTSGYSIQFENYDETTNIIKWNQIDIPIRQGEDVVIRIRYKYNIGQPFIDLYTPWSENYTVTFPTEYEEDTEISDILQTNDNDVVTAKFSETLINDGYQDHISNKIIDNSQKFYHMPENIYSGYNTNENKMISLKDKLDSIITEVTEYKTYINNELNSNFEVYLEYDNTSIQLTPNILNTITIANTSSINNTFNVKHMNIVVKNTGNVNINFYSIFPGETSMALLEDDEEFNKKYIVNYERVPLLIGNDSDFINNITYQTLGQWIYFRQNSPYSYEDIYLNTQAQRSSDIANINTGNSLSFLDDITKYLSSNTGVLLGYRDRTSLLNNSFVFNTIGTSSLSNLSNKISGDSFKYKINKDENKYILKYEHIYDNTGNKHITESTNLSTESSFTFNIGTTEANISQLNGVLLTPELETRSQILCDTLNTNQYLVLNEGKTISVPLTLEYYFSNDINNYVSYNKSLYFDLRPSVIKDPVHYMLNIVVTSNNTL